MKIGIFGDSFGEKSYVPETATSKAWTTYIAEEFDIDNYCVSGSSFYYSAKLFLTNHHLYDKIIFLVTDPGRLEILPDFVINSMQSRITDYTVASILAEETGNHIYKVAADYFVYFNNYDKECLFQYALLEKLKNAKSNDVLFLPCFRYSFDEQDRNDDELFKISKLDENDTLLQVAGKRKEYRHCHFNSQNNIIFAEKIKNWINTGFWKFELNDFVHLT